MSGIAYGAHAVIGSSIEGPESKTTIAEARALRIIAADAISSADTTELIAGARNCAVGPSKHTVAVACTIAQANTAVVAWVRKSSRTDLAALWAVVSGDAVVTVGCLEGSVANT